MKKIMMILVASLFVLFGCSGDFILQTTFPNDDKNTSEEVDKDAINSDVYVNRTYKVGSNIPAGEYYIEVTNDAKQGYFAVSSDFEGLDVYYNDYITDRAYATLSNGQYLILENAIATPVSNSDAIDQVSSINDNGIYKVGSDLVEGLYKVVAENNNSSEIDYYIVYSDSTYENIITSGVLDKNEVAYVMLNNEQYIMLNNVAIEAY